MMKPSDALMVMLPPLAFPEALAEIELLFLKNISLEIARLILPPSPEVVAAEISELLLRNRLSAESSILPPFPAPSLLTANFAPLSRESLPA